MTPPLTKIILQPPTLSFMALLSRSLLFMALLTANTLYADQKIISDDGREVLLNDDGSWQYRSSDRFATTSDGRRVRLKEDGRWSYDGNAPLRSTEQVRTSDLDIKLQRVVVEKYQKKVQKNTRVKTQTVFYLSLKTSAQAKHVITVRDSDISLIEVKDNNGKDYPVLSVQPHATIEPGNTATMIIRTDKSPRLFDDVKSMDIIFKPGIFGLDKAVSFSVRTGDFQEEKVDGFESLN